MKIVELINSLENRNGAQVFCADLSVALCKTDEIFVVSLFSGCDNSFRKSFSEAGINYQTVKKTKKFDFAASLRLKKLLKSINPDIIHVHLSCLPTYFLSMGCRKRKWKIIETMHSIPGSTLGRYASFIRKIFLNKNGLKLVAISEQNMSKAVELYGSKRVCMIRNGVAFSSIDAEPSQAPEYDFICVASFSPVKNHSMLLRAMKSVTEKYPKAKLLCVGGGELLDKIKNLVQKMELSQNVFFTGQVDCVAPFLKKSKIFVLASKREGNPLSVLEAMRAGLPIVAPSVGGIPDIISEPEGGLLYATSSENALAASMELLLNNSELAGQMGRYNKTKSEQFNIGVCSEQYRSLFLKETGNGKI